MFLPSFDIRNLVDAAVSYLLSANFNVSNHTFSNGDDVETASGPSAVQNGALVVRDADASASAAISTNKLRLTQPNSAWDDLNVSDSNGQTRALGLTLLATVSCEEGTTTTPASQFRVAFQSDSGQWPAANTDTHLAVKFEFFTTLTYGVFLNNTPTQINSGLTPLTLSTDYSAAIIVGGSNSSGTPYKAGDTKADFDYGGAFFAKGGSEFGANWKLLYRSFSQAAATIYPSVGVFGSLFDVDNLRIPDVDLSALLEPNNLSTSVSTTDTFTHISDCVIEALVTTLPSSGNLDIEFRRQDDSNKWIARVSSAGALSLIEVVAGGETSRASTPAAISNGERLVIIADDTDIWLSANDAVAGSYASASNFSNDTGGKIVFASGAVAHLVDWARGTNGEYSDLDSYPGAT